MKKRNLLLICLLVFALLVGCSEDSKTGESEEKESQNESVEVTVEKESDLEEEIETEEEEVVVNSLDKDFTYDKAPEKIFTNELNLLEILVELGLEDKVVSYAIGHYTVEDALERNQDKIRPLNCIGEFTSLENIVESGADFAYVNPSSFSDDIMDNLIDKDINIYACRTNYVKGAGIDDVYEDIRNLGKIFRVEDKADDLIEKLKKDQEEITKDIDYGRPPRILVYDFGGDSVFTAGGGLESELIEKAGGENIFSDIDSQWGMVSWEEIVSRNPEIIIIHEYPESDSFEDKKDFLMGNEILKDVDAIKNENFIRLPLIKVFTGIQINEGIEVISQGINNVDL